MKQKRQVKVFLGPLEVAGYYSNLAKGFSSLGVPCTYYVNKPHRFGYGGENPRPSLLRVADFFDSIRNSIPSPKFLDRLLGTPSLLFWFLWVIKTILSHDVFVFGYGRSFTSKSKWDLWLIRKLRKRLIINMAHGSEARPPYLDGARQDADGKKSLSTNEIIVLSIKIRELVQTNFRYADFIIGAPYSTSFFSNGKLINWFSLGVPSLTREIDASPANVIAGNSVRILHSPSHPALKGTSEILNAIERLRMKGHAIDLVLLSGRPHAEVLEEIKKCDFVVDQIYSDTPMASFATEAAGFGKPCIVGGYGLEELRAFVPEDMWPPTKICRPEGIQDAIEELILNKEYRVRLGEEAREFVKRRWNAVEVAKRYLAIANGEIPESWWFDPHRVSYLYGCGQSRSRTVKCLKEILGIAGIQGLQLSHRPDLENAFVSLADSPLA